LESTDVRRRRQGTHPVPSAQGRASRTPQESQGAADAIDARIATIPFGSKATTTRRSHMNLRNRPSRKRRSKRSAVRRRLQISWTLLSFLLMVAIPALPRASTTLSSPARNIDRTQFRVAGSSRRRCPPSVCPACFGSTTESSDSYIVASYIDSVQLVRDIKEQLGIDLRQYYAKNNIDFWYRIDPNNAARKVHRLLERHGRGELQLHTGNTTLYIYGFSPEDTKAIADAVLKVSERSSTTCRKEPPADDDGRVQTGRPLRGTAAQGAPGNRKGCKPSKRPSIQPRSSRAMSN